MRTKHYEFLTSLAMSLSFGFGCSFSLTFPTYAAAVGTGTDATTDKVAKEHKGWANPQGILVSTDGGKVNAPEKKDKNADDPPPPASNDELAVLVKGMTPPLTKCFAALREADSDLQKRGGRYAFNLEFVIGTDGKVGSVNQVKKGGSKNLPGCATAVRDQVAAHAFRPPAEAQPLDAHLEYEIVVQDDDEAQGRGFQYIAGEEAWEAALRTHQDWFKCEAAADCAMTAELCEARAVNKASLAEYSAAITARKKPKCYKKIDLESYQLGCKNRKCSSFVRVKPR